MPLDETLVTGEDEEVVDSPSTLMTEEDKSSEEEAPKESEADAEGDAEDKPKESGELEFTVPEGMVINEPLLKEFASLAKEHGLSQEVGQQLVDLQAKYEQERYDGNNKAWDDMQADWTAAVQSDKEYGGADLKANVAIAKTALKEFGTPELTEMLNFTGAGNHPEFVRLLYRVGKAIGEDNLVTGGKETVSTEEVDIAKRLFPDAN